MLIRLRGCAGWSAPLLFAYGIRHVFAWRGPYVNNKDTDQPAHPHSLISLFIVHSLDVIITVDSTPKLWKLASFCSWAGRFVLPGPNPWKQVFSWHSSVYYVTGSSPYISGPAHVIDTVTGHLKLLWRLWTLSFIIFHHMVLLSRWNLQIHPLNLMT